MQDTAGPSSNDLASNDLASNDLALSARALSELTAAAAPLPGGWLGQQLQRLQRLMALRDAHATHLNDEGRRLLDHAIFTTFVDCRDLGGEQLASSLLTSPDGAVAEETAKTESNAGPDLPIG